MPTFAQNQAAARRAKREQRLGQRLAQNVGGSPSSSLLVPQSGENNPVVHPPVNQPQPPPYQTGGLEPLPGQPSSSPSTPGPIGSPPLIPAGQNEQHTGPGSPNPYNDADLFSMFGLQPGNKFDDLYNRATTGSIQSLDTAANRLRERLDIATNANVQGALNSGMSHNPGFVGLTNAAAYRQRAAGMQAYAQGLNDLYNQGEQNRLQGLGIAGNAAQSQQQNRQFIDNLLAQLINSREQRDSAERTAGNQSMAEQRLQELIQQNENWRRSLEQLFGSGMSGGVGSGGFSSVSGE